MVGIEDLAIILRHNASTYELPVLNCYSTAKYFLLHLKGCYSAKTTQQTLMKKVAYFITIYCNEPHQCYTHNDSAA